MPRHNTTNNHALIKFFSEWFKNESGFIFWMLILNITFSSVSYRFIFRSPGDFLFESLVLMRDTCILFFCVVLPDFIIYCLFSKLKLIHNALKTFFIMASIIVFTADVFSIYYYRMRLTGIMVDVALTTNIKELSEFFEVYVFNSGFCICFISVISAAFMLKYILSFLFRHISGILKKLCAWS